MGNRNYKIPVFVTSDTPNRQKQGFVIYLRNAIKPLPLYKAMCII